MVDAVRGYALSGQNPDSYRLLRTDDGGRRWLDITPGRGKVHPSGPIGIFGPQTRLLATKLRAGLFAVERSDDGGSTWRQSLSFRDQHGLGIGQPSAVDARHLYVAVDEGAAAGSQGQALYSSSDGGYTWRFVSRTAGGQVAPRTLPFGCDKSGFGFSTPSRGWAGGYCAGGASFFYRTNDGGHSWRLQTLPRLAQCACETTAPQFFNGRGGVFSVTGFTMNGGGKPLARAYWTQDGGTHWRPSAPAAGRIAGAISFADARTAWLAATQPGRIYGPFDRLFRTSDAGRHWQALKLPFDAEGYELDALNANAAYALRFVDGSSSIRRTKDGGRTWQTVRAVEATS